MSLLVSVLPFARRSGALFSGSESIMLAFVQFPMSDVRLFVNQETGRLPAPTWPFPTPYKDFVRSFGVVRVRTRKGLSGWVGENEICSADSAIKFSDLPDYRPPSWTESKIGLKCASRHFYHDGFASSKLEVVLLTWPRHLKLSTGNFVGLLIHILNLPIRIKQPYEQPASLELFRAAKYLAKLYLFSSTLIKKHPNVRESWVQPGYPTMFLELGRGEQAVTPASWNTRAYLGKGLDLHQWWLREKNGPQLSVWVLKYDKHCDQKTTLLGRSLRLYIMRLHTEFECLKNILKLVTESQIEISADTHKGQLFQVYLNELTRRINRNANKAKKIAGDSVVSNMAAQAWESINPGQKEAFLSKLSQWKIRPQVYRKIEEITYNMEVTMGDKYEADQVFSQGPAEFEIENMEVNQQYDARKQTLNLSQLAADLATLREKLNELADTPEQFVAVGEVAAAEIAVQEGNVTGVKQHLKKAGQWALDVATNIGVRVAAAMISQSMQSGP